MRSRVVAEDFYVEERIALPPSESGPFTLYRILKRGITTLEVQARMARALRRPPSALTFPALKDKQAVAVQYATLRGDGPAQVEGPGFVAERVGRTARPLTPSDLRGNHFVLVLRDLGDTEDQAVTAQIEAIGQEGLPNYFGQQRFGSQTASGDFPGRRILLRDAEGALRAHLTEPMAGDPPEVRAFKKVAASHWGEWPLLLQAAPRPSNYRSVLTYLCDHPQDWRHALNLVTPRLLSLYLDAYQSLLWNRIAARYLEQLAGKASRTVRLAREAFPLFRDLSRHISAGASLPLPSHRAVYTDPLAAEAAAHVLHSASLQIGDLKARLLQRAYLSRGQRRLLLLPQEASVSPLSPDERFVGHFKLTIAFTLPPGAYATLVLQALHPG